jgi:DNA-binding NarL/FixJ family response regulator
MKKPRVFLADDHAMILEGIKKLLEPAVDLVGSAGNGLDLITNACRLKPDVILMDISMPGLNGIDAAEQLRKKLPNTKLIFLTMHGDADYVSDAFRVGVSGYVLKSSAISELTQAIQAVVRGETYVTSLVKAPAKTAPKSASAENLTARQREVLQLMAEGRCPKEISSLLKISVRTVEFHKYSIMQKLGLYSIADLTKYAVRHRLTE